MGMPDLTAIAADIVMRGEETEQQGAMFRFQHDRVQEAAVDMLADLDRAQIHARIGRCLLASASEDVGDRHLVAIADHLIAGRDHLAPEERAKLHDLTLLAAKRTKQANAWDAALAYLDVAQELQGPDAWDAQPAQAFQIAHQIALITHDGLLEAT